MDITAFDKELIKKFLQFLDDSQKGVTSHPDFSYSKNNHHLLSPQGQYAQKVFRYYSRIMEILEDLKKVEVFLRRYPLKRFYEIYDIDYLSYSKYHMEVFFHKIHTLLDLLKLMLNEVLEIGLPTRKCTWESLKKHPKCQDSASLQIIHYFHKSFEHVITARHLNTHRGIFNDEDSDDIRMPMMIYKNSKRLNMEVGDDLRRIMPEFIIEYRLRKYKKEKVLFIKNGNEVATQYVNMFMNVTLPNFFDIAEGK